MSFQGDVGGIGLAELLQSLARGRRDGVLHLNSRNGLSCRLGLDSGVVSFLPDEDEDPNYWKDRVRQAWIDDADFRSEAMRMSEIARAHRLERVYRILDSEGVHFRFNPGEHVAQPGSNVETGSEDPGAARMPQVLCSGIPVEFLLLEYARLSDELESVSGQMDFTDFVAPRAMDPAAVSERQDRFLLHCDGVSTLTEIADRLAMPMREARLTLVTYYNRGELRLADWRELLVLAQHELSQGHVSRASARLIGWIQCSPPGPLEPGDAQLLAAEFKAERMGPLLNLMPAREARIMLRRIDHALEDDGATVKHWREMQRLKRSCPITVIHRMAVEYRWEDDDELPTHRELLDLARILREDGHPMRAAAFLRMAASREPANANSRLEIGLGMLGVDLIEEGAAWILDACQTLIASGHAEKAVTALRTLLEADGSIREARRMLGRLRHLTVRRQLIRKNSLVGMAIVAILTTTAWVRVSSERKRELKLAEIADLIEQPEQARALLDEYFPEDDSPRIEHLREMIVDRRKFQENEWRSNWYESYREAQLACSLGEAVDGLKLALAMPAPPKLQTVDEPWPLVSDLFNGLAARLENEHDVLGELELDGLQQVEREKKLQGTIEAVLEHIDSQPREVNAGDLVDRLTIIRKDILRRIQERSDSLERRTHDDLIHRQDLILARARSHKEAGLYRESLDEFEALVATDETGKLAKIFAEDISEVRHRYESLQSARELAKSGTHEEALEVLGEAFDSQGAHPLPWTIEAFPKGAIVHLADKALPAPFVIESRIGERIELRVEYPDHHPRTIVVDSPANQLVWLSKIAERSWKREGRIDALPVSFGDHHIVCDRTGHVARLGPGAAPVWQEELLSLGGFGRAPVFLPASPDRFLLLTEDGEAWLFDSETGEREGPWILGSGPAEGPSPTTDGVIARLKDGRLMKWTERVRPVEIKSGDVPEVDQRGALGGMEVLWRGDAGRRELESPWTDWGVQLEDETYRVRQANDEESGFTVRRQGDWSYLAWEAPTPVFPAGRLWISDGSGLSAYQP